MNAFFTLIEYTSPTFNGTHTIAPFDLNSRFVIYDSHGAGGYAGLLAAMTNLQPLHVHELVSTAQAQKQTFILFRNAIVGVRKQANWYQYGYTEPQGPIAKKKVSGYWIRKFSNFLYSRLVVERGMLENGKDLVISSKPLSSLDDNPNVDKAHFFPAPKIVSSSLPPPPLNPLDGPTIVLFSRTLNRRITNEAQLIGELNEQFPEWPVTLVRLEETSTTVIARVLKRAKIAIGMHGSILILTIFMQPGSLVIEMFPYAVPSNNYTPFKTMALMDGMQLYYAAWEVI